MRDWPTHTWHQLTMLLSVAVVIGVLSAALAISYTATVRESRELAFWHCLIGRGGTWIEVPIFWMCIGTRVQ